MKKAKWMTKMLVLGLVIGAVPVSAGAAATPVVKVQSIPAKLSLDDQSYGLPTGQHVFMYQNRTYVPLRYVSSVLKKSVKWDAAKKTVTVSEPAAAELAALQAALKGASSSAPATGWMKASAIQVSFVFNGTVQKLPKDQSAFIYNNSIYVPLRFMSEAVGLTITWDSKANMLTVKPGSVDTNPTPSASSGQGSETGNAGGNGTTGSEGNPPQGSGQPNGTVGGSGGSGGGTGGSGGGPITGTTEESIRRATEAKLNTLRSQCQDSLTNLAIQYINEKDGNKKKQLIASGQQTLNECRTKFEQVVSDASVQLSANGYSTSIITEYRNKFESEVNQGMEILKAMLG